MDLTKSFVLEQLHLVVLCPCCNQTKIVVIVSTSYVSVVTARSSSQADRIAATLPRSTLPLAFVLCDLFVAVNFDDSVPGRRDDSVFTVAIADE